MPAVEPVPAPDSVERMEEAGHVLWLGLLEAGRVAEPELVERGHRHRVEQSTGGSDRYPQEGPGDELSCRFGTSAQTPGQILQAGMVAAGEHRPAQSVTGRLTVDPCHRVAVVTVPGEHLLHHRVEIGGSFGVDQQVAGLDRDHLDGRVGDDAGEAHAPRCRPEQRRIRLGGHPSGPGGGHQGHLEDVRTEAPVDVVVLAVDVGSDGAPDGDQPGTRGHRDEPTERHQTLHQRLQADPGPHCHDARVEVDLEVGVEPGRVDHRAAGVLGGVSVAPAQSPGDHPAPTPARRGDRIGQRLFDRVRVHRSDHLGGSRGGPTPPRQQCSVPPVNGHAA